MKHEDWIKLTKEQQRIRVAEIRGWANIRKVRGATPTGEGRDMLVGESPLAHQPVDCAGIPYGVSNVGCRVWEIPYYLNDLNATNKLMIIIRDTGMFARYYTELRNIFAARGLTFSSWHEHNTDADIRAEAFALTIENK